MPPSANRPGRVDPLLGSVVAGRYRIEAKIASGGMGTVYRAEQLGLERKVALKLLHAAALEGTEDSQSQDDFAVLEKRFSREAAILAKLAHPNIVTIFDYGSVEPADDGSRPRFYMAMELLGGETLHDRLTKRRRLPADELVPLARQIARGLREAHAQGIVHRDLKPANIMIVRDRDGEEAVKLLDFGIGKVLEIDGTADMSTTDPRAELTQEGRFVGSPMYMAPEQIAHGHVDLRADVYSFGTVLYRCLAGAHPFHKDNTALVMIAHLHEKPVPLCERAPDVPAWLGDLVDRCMAKEPDQRPSSMEEVLGLLQSSSTTSSARRIAPIEPLPEHVSEPTIATGRHHSLLTPHTTSRPQTLADAPTLASVPPPQRRFPLLAVLGVALGLGVFLTVFVVARGKTTSEPPAPAPSAPASNAKVDTTFTLELTSTPTGAEVREGDLVLGKTPLRLSVERASVAAQPRTFVVSAPDHQPYTLVQGSATGTVTIVAALQPLPPAPPAPSPSSTSTVKSAKSIAPKASATAPPLDIIPKR